MSRQRLYVNERGDRVVNDSGFSWFAALVMPIWALHKRLYGLAALLLLLGGAINLYTDAATGWLLYLAQVLLYGRYANRVHRWLLERRGWRVTAEEPLPVGGKP